MRHSISSHHLNLKPTLFSSTNCVLLADSIVGEAGTDILSPQGFIVPGTYQDYLDLEFKKPSGIVVSRSIY